MQMLLQNSLIKRYISWTAVFSILLLLSLYLFFKFVYHYYPANAFYYLIFDDPYKTNTSEDNLQNLENARVSWLGNLENPSLDELSGLAASHQSEGVLYGINDSGGYSEIFVMNYSGQHLAKINIDLPRPRDWEDMATFQVKQTKYILIADTGDNLRWHNDGVLHLIEEPKLDSSLLDMMSGETQALNLAIEPLKVIRSLTFQFPDGPRDCEAIGVDVQSGSVFLASKRTLPPEVYRIPLEALLNPQVNSESILKAELYAFLPGIPGPTDTDLREDPDNGHYRSTLTAFDIKDNKAVVVTYKDAYLYEKSVAGEWRQAFSDKPRRIPLPPAWGREAGAFSSTTDHFLVSGERKDGIGAQAIFQIEFN